MENKKFEQLIDLIINENEDKARELFHEIVVEKSREIYENIMDEGMHDEEAVEEGDSSCIPSSSFSTSTTRSSNSSTLSPSSWLTIS